MKNLAIKSNEKEVSPTPPENGSKLAHQAGLFCPNCAAKLEGRKCKLFCPTPGCGYLVTCSECELSTYHDAAG